MRATATFGSTESGRKLVFDATGGFALTSDEISWPLPEPLASTGVRFTIAASPAFPLTEKHSCPDGATNPPPSPVLVSTRRSGAPDAVAGE